MCSNTHQRPHFPICCSYKRRTRHKRGTRRGSEIDGTRRIIRCAAFRGPSGGSVLSLYGVIVEWRAQEGCEKNIFRCERVNVPIIKRTFFLFLDGILSLFDAQREFSSDSKCRAYLRTTTEALVATPLFQAQTSIHQDLFILYCTDLVLCTE